VRRTWAPVGSTPVLDHHFNWQRVSIAAALCYGSRGGGARLAVHLRDRPYDTDALIDALTQLRRFLAGEKATLLWDGLPAHRSRDMQRFLTSQQRWLVVERLPGYAPDLNPVEALWANLKGVELANLTADTLDEVTQAVTHGIQRVRQTPHLPFSFLRHSGLAA
jgi:transposase